MNFSTNRNQHLASIHMRQPLWYRHYNVWPHRSIKRSSLPFTSHRHKCFICSIDYFCYAKDRLPILEMLNTLSISFMKSGSKWNHTIIQPISYVCNIFAATSGHHINRSNIFHERFQLNRLNQRQKFERKLLRLPVLPGSLLHIQPN